jgi:predicted dehydrogenase
MSFDAVATTSSNIEVHGSEGTLAVPDPNHFDGETRLFRLGGTEWETLPVSAGYAGSGRGYGIADLAATPEGEEPRASGTLAYHVLDVMESLLDSAHSGKAVAVTSRAERPSAVPLTGEQG